MPHHQLTKFKGFWVPAGFQELPGNPKEAQEQPYSGAVAIIRRMMRLQGLSVTILGAENIPADGGAMIAMNHTSYLDFTFGGIPAFLRGQRLVRYMCKKEIFDVPVLGGIMNAFHHIPVDRAAGRASLLAAIDRLKDGDLVGIFPEGTISRSFELKQFKTGAVRIAARAGVPLLPLVAFGSQRLWTKDHPKQLGRTKTPIMIKVGPPVDISGHPQDASERLRATMAQMLDELRAEYIERFGPFPEGEFWMPASLGGGAPTPEKAESLDDKERVRRSERREQKRKEKERARAEKTNRTAEAALERMTPGGQRLRTRFRTAWTSLQELTGELLDAAKRKLRK